MTTLTLRSPSFDDRQPIPARHSRKGDNVSPALTWGDVPDGTAELVLVVEDPDAPSGIFTHWIVANLSPDATGIEEGKVPPGAVEGRNSFGEDGYDGPQPPPGDEPHRYAFRLYALSRSSGLADGATPEEVAQAVDTDVLGEGVLVGTFGG